MKIEKYTFIRGSILLHLAITPTFVDLIFRLIEIFILSLFNFHEIDSHFISSFDWFQCYEFILHYWTIIVLVRKDLLQIIWFRKAFFGILAFFREVKVNKYYIILGKNCYFFHSSLDKIPNSLKCIPERRKYGCLGEIKTENLKGIVENWAVNL